MTQLYKEYAQALFMLSLECEKTDEYALDLEKVRAVFSDNPELTDLLTSPAVYLSERLDIIDKAFSESVCEDVCSFLKLLCEKKIIQIIMECIDEFKRLHQELKNISFIRVISAVELSEGQKAKLVEKMTKTTNKNISPIFVVDKDILGGIIIETEGKILDGSLRYKLKDVKDVMSR